MEKHWANLDLHVDVDLGGGRPGRSLEGALRAAVRDGRLAPGTRLPASRTLAADLGIARNTVADVYAQLTAEGWLTARTGAGTWVTERFAAADGGDGREPAAPGQAAPQPRYSLHAGIPDLTAFPRQDWLAAARKALNSSSARALEYPDPRGVPELREALAGYLARVRGVTVGPERIVVCAGFKHGLALLCRVLRERGAATIAAEAFGLPEHRRVISGAGLRLAPMPVDADGAVPDDAVLADAAAALLTPAHQFPLGGTLSPRRRRRFTEWAASSGAVLIEDDYDGEFRYDRHPVGALHALAPRHVVYGGTASKALAPGLRLGWLAIPARLVDDVVAAARLSGGGPDVIGQLTLAELITSGGYDRQVRQARLAYRRRRDQLVAALRREAPAVGVGGIAAGLHALLHLPPGLTEADVMARAARRGVAVDGLAAYTADAAEPEPARASTGHPPALVAGYACPPPHAFTTAVTHLCAALSA
jgi:GntR family transcriptional regulator/MocR family aminotransferase